MPGGEGGKNSDGQSSDSASIPSATEPSNVLQIAEEDDKTCWVCFATESDDRLAAWVQPCKCIGTTKWVR